MKKWVDSVRETLETGVGRYDRTGTGTVSRFGVMERYDLSQGFPLNSAKATSFNHILHENLWFLKGRSRIKYLIDNGVRIWNEWVIPETAVFAGMGAPVDYFFHHQPEYLKNMYRKRYPGKPDPIRPVKLIDGDVGPIYPLQWRDCPRTRTPEECMDLAKRIIDRVERTGGSSVKEIASMLSWEQAPRVDQIQEVIDTLRTNPDSRRMIVSSWNVSMLHEMNLPPCHHQFQFYSRKAIGENGEPIRKLDLLFNMRSNDQGLGQPYNIAGYALINEMIAHVTNHVPGELIQSTGDVHVYSNHVDQLSELINDAPSYPLPKLIIKNKRENIDDFVFEDFELVGYESGPVVKLPVAI